MSQKKRISPVALVSLLMSFGISISLFACNSTPKTTETPQPTQSQEAQGGKNTPAKALLKVAGVSNSDPLTLLQSEQMKKELKLTDDQVSKLKQLNTNLRAEMDRLTSGIGSDPSKLTDEQKKQKKEEIDKINQNARKELGNILNADQITRSKQIFLQVYGFGVLTQQDFKSDLKLTADQDKKMQDLGKELLVEVQQNWEIPKGSQEEQNKILASNTEKVEKLVEESNKEAVKLLTPDQQKTLEQLKGAKFELDTSKLKRV